MFTASLQLPEEGDTANQFITDILMRVSLEVSVWLPEQSRIRRAVIQSWKCVKAEGRHLD